MQIFQIPEAVVRANDVLIRTKNPNHVALVLNEARTNPGELIDLAIGHGKVLFPRKGNGLIRCFHCGRKLTNGVSRMRGVGPTCFGRKGGIAGRPTNPMEVYKMYVRACKEHEEIPLTFIEWAN